MKRSILWSLILILVISLLAVGSQPAQAGAPTQWTRVPFTTPDSPNSGVTSMQVFKGDLFAASQDYENGLRIWRMEKNGSWVQVNEAGFGDPLLSTPEEMISYNGMLYIATGDWLGRTPGEIWRSPDGVNWEPVTQDGFGQEGFGSFLRFVAFNDMLYVSADMMWLSDDTPVGGQIWRSATGAPGSWQKVVDNGLGDPLSIGINDFIVYKGALYAQVQTDWIHPTRIWRSVDGANWEVIKNDGFGYLDPLPEGAFYYDSPGAFAIFRDYLYIGLATIRMDTIDWDHPANNTGIGQIWRTKDGYHWEPVMQGGFGDWRNHKIDALVAYQGQLYAFAWVDNWVMTLYEEGMQVWRSSDGIQWTQINESGFGDAYNWTTHMSIDIASYKGSLYLGTLNDNGGQIWKLSVH